MVRVVKVGGSLFIRPGLISEVRDWLADQPPVHHVLIVGGGEFADQIRQLERRGGVTAASAHWLAIRAMSLLAWTLCHLEPAWSYLDDWPALVAAVSAGTGAKTIVFDPAPFLREHEPAASGTPLPVGWQVTSDSIAARVAQLLAAQELVLLKSAPTIARDAQQASHAGYVDAFFPRAACQLPRIRCVDLPGGGQTLWSQS
jgi:5-(aminomethyl)-3-furanmethanol phosphate kinase